MFKKKSVKPKFSTLTVALSALCVGVVAPTASAADVADPDYQIKLKLRSDLVNAQGILKSQVADKLNAQEADAPKQLAYLEDSKGTLGDSGWTVRLALKPGDDQYEVTYKFREPLSSNDLSKSTVDAALKRAKEQNFDASDTNYDAQVNASFATSTLDFSTKKTVSCEQWDCVFPSADVARDIVTDLEPGKLEKKLNGSLADLDLKMSTVVEESSQRIEVGDISTDLEVVDMNGSYWVEVSEDETSREDAIRKRDTLIDELNDLGYLVEEDAFKTEKVIAGQW